MVELERDPKSIAAFRGRLAPREVVLWADSQRGPGKRELKWLVPVGIVVTTVVAIVAALAPAATVLIAILWGPSIGWTILRLRSRHFAVTDKRVLFVSSVWPRISGAWALHELNPHLVRHGEGRSIIHLSQAHFPMGLMPLGFWSDLHAREIPTYIENVPNIEAVRQLILRTIATAPPLEPADRKSVV